MSLLQVVSIASVLATCGLMILIPYQVRSTYWVMPGYGDGWLLVQRFHVFGITWDHAWCVDVPNARWVELRTNIEVPEKKAQWLNQHVAQWQKANA